MRAPGVAVPQARGWPGVELVVLAAALVPRLAIPLANRGGLHGTYGYDPSVYYAAADALLHGRLPYRDFVLLHPPGIAIAATPFAWLGELTSDDSGFIAANLAFTVLGALNAVLVVRVATRLGLLRSAAAVGGLCYAVWFGAVNAEYVLRLEPLGNFAVLCGLLAYARAADDPRRRWPLVAGVGLGAAVTVKIWYAVPLLLVALWHLRAERRARFPQFVAGATGAVLIVCGPFFLLAPRQMWSMVVTDQLSRGRGEGGIYRLVGLTDLRTVEPHLSRSTQVTVVVVAAALLLLLCAAALQVPNAGMPVSLLAAEVLTLMLSPSWFNFYDDYAAPGLALTTAAAATWVVRTGRVPRAVTACGVGAAASALAAVTIAAPQAAVRPYPSAQFAEAVESDRCVMSDSPMALIELGVLTRDLADGCRNWVDVTGRTYGPDRAVLPDGRSVPRPENRHWQRDLIRYLLSGNAVTLERPEWTGVGPQLRQILRRERVLARVGGLTVYGTTDRGRD